MVTVYLTDDLLIKIEAEATSRHRSRNQQITFILEKYYKKGEKQK